MKQEIIEEMARIIAFELCPNRAIHKKWGEEAQCYSDNNFAECKEIKNVVDKLYNTGYRKIPENAVVMTREEYDELKKGVKTYNYTAMFNAQDAYRWEQGYLQGTKETAEKFVERLKEQFADSARLCEQIDEIAKEFTEGKV